MATTTIPWNDGSGDNIYLTYPSASGDQIVEVTSDAHIGHPRLKIVTFSTDIGDSGGQLTVTQEGYVTVHYVNMPGTSYLDMGVQLSEIDGAIEADLQLNEVTAQMRIAVCHSEETQDDPSFQVYVNGSKSLGFRCRGSWTGVSNYTFDTSRHWIYASAGGNRVTVDGTNTAFTASGDAGTYVSNTTIGGRYNEQPRLNAKIYGAIAYSNGVAIRDYRFVRDSNNVPYAYDLINKTLTPFSGTGTTVGKDVTIVRLTPSSYDSTDKAYYSISNPSNAYDGFHSTTYTQIQLTRGTAGAVTYVYFKFDTSRIPANATIESVTCQVKIYISNSTSTNVAARRVQLFSGTTAKGSSVTAQTTTLTKSLPVDTWTREEVNDVRIRLYAERGTANLNSSYYFRFYGATLTIAYSVPEQACITFSSSSSNTLALTKNGTSDPTLYVSTDKQTWTQWDGSAISFSAGHPVFMYGNNSSSFSSSTDNYSTFTIGGDGAVECTGNIMTLVDDTGTAMTIPRTYYFYRLFRGCTALTKAPDLPATTLKNYCYKEMFYGCSNLVDAPSELPATTLTTQCYYQMFRGCTSLVTAPVLPALTLASQCYNYLFYGCSKLQYVKAMFTTTPGSGYTTSWAYNWKTGGTFVKNKDAQWSVSGADGIPASWTIILE